MVPICPDQHVISQPRSEPADHDNLNEYLDTGALENHTDGPCDDREIGGEAKLAFVLIVLALTPPLRRLLTVLPAWVERIPLYAMGTLAAYWCFDRAAAAWWGF